MKKKLFIVVCSLVVFAVVGWFVYEKVGKSIELKLLKNKIEIEYGNSISYDVKNYVDLSELDQNEIKKIQLKIEDTPQKECLDIGQYKIKVQYKKQNQYIDVIVKDSTSPTLKKGKDILETDVGKGISNELIQKEFVFDDLSDVKIDFYDNDVNYKKAGKYKACVEACDTSYNKTSKEIVVKVKEEQKEIPKKEEIKEKKYKKESTNIVEKVAVQKEEVPVNNNIETEVIRLINQERSYVGLPALSTNQALYQNTNTRANEISQSFSHTRPDGQDWYSVLTVSYHSAGEILASGQESASEVVNDWMNSDSHRANILDNSFTSCCAIRNGNNWVVLFIG